MIKQLFATIIISCLGLPESCPAADAVQVEFEIVLENGLAPTAAQDWMEVFKELDPNGLRVRTANGEDRPKIDKQQVGSRTTYRVMGVVRLNNTLILPGATFRFQDKAKIRQWIEKLKADGDESIGESAGAFGLIPKQLLALHDSLAVKVSISTKGKSVQEIVTAIVRGLKIEVTIDPSAQPGMRDPLPIGDEFQGLSAGTVLAATVRPVGLIVVPERPKGGEVRIRITDSGNAKESWPIGWPMTRPTTESIPKLLEFLEVEIKDTPLSEALPAIQDRLEVPFLVDYNSLARKQVDLEKSLVTFPGKRTFYSKLLDRVLAKYHLTWEVRKDELEQSFIWISAKR